MITGNNNIIIATCQKKKKKKLSTKNIQDAQLKIRTDKRVSGQIL